MSASFHVPEPGRMHLLLLSKVSALLLLLLTSVCMFVCMLGVRHQQPPPAVPDPETLLSWTDVIKK
jgi:hypothetical protein